MKRTAMELAAIATAAVPGLSPVGFAALSDDAEDFDSALIVDAQKLRWRVRSPRHDEASMRLEAELSALRAFSAKVRAGLPFALPSVAGTVRQGSLRTFVYKDLPGRVPTLDELVDEGSSLAKALGQCMAAIHQIPDESVEIAGLPTYTANEVRQRKLNELDTAAATGKVPSRLLRRWEHAMEDVALWRFNATVVHGDFDEEQIQISHSSITAVKGWTDLHVGDPADDFAWLSAVEDQNFSERVFAAYVEARGKSADPHIMRRAALAAEFALAQWLVKSIDSKDSERIAEAEMMLKELDQNISEYGGQPLSVVEAPRPINVSTPESFAPAKEAAAQAPPESAAKVVSLPKQQSPTINTSKVSALGATSNAEADAALKAKETSKQLDEQGPSVSKLTDSNSAGSEAQMPKVEKIAVNDAATSKPAEDKVQSTETDKAEVSPSDNETKDESPK
ncbi:phosphotransferase [Glutamicibacter sp.]|uniref:phosphotransferase n=1 Tax=Glutamicibacter sp. TaxID=1931995 RepID=UPI0028BF29FB|nr:phosphotransferase [Glutamicibacter sp.]